MYNVLVLLHLLRTVPHIQLTTDNSQTVRCRVLKKTFTCTLFGFKLGELSPNICIQRRRRRVFFSFYLSIAML